MIFSIFSKVIVIVTITTKCDIVYSVARYNRGFRVNGNAFFNFAFIHLKETAHIYSAGNFNRCTPILERERERERERKRER
jgi:hypothetical protein